MEKVIKCNMCLPTVNNDGQVHCLFEEITDCIFNLCGEVIYIFAWEITG